MRLFNLLLAGFLSTTFLACDEKDDVGMDDPCSQDLLCTEVFITIGANITLDGSPVNLTTCKSTIVSTGTEINCSEKFTDFEGYHAIVTDSELDEINMDGSEVRLKGTYVTENETYTIDETYTIGHDCCHVMLISGKETIELE